MSGPRTKLIDNMILKSVLIQYRNVFIQKKKYFYAISVAVYKGLYNVPYTNNAHYFFPNVWGHIL